jgi:uncharacterized phage protein (TIGR02218 family)
MSFGSQEESRQLGEPVNLYQFRYGPGANDVFCYADCEEEVVFNGLTFIPTPIDRDNITSKTSLDKAELEIRTLQDTQLANLFRYYPPSEVVTLVIFQGHNQDISQQWLAAWSGRVLGFKIDGNMAHYTCLPVSTSMQRPGLRRHYQYGCPHLLYGQGAGRCNANKAAATITRTVSALFSNAIELPNSWETDSARKLKYANGMIEWTGGGRTERRTILDIQSDNRLLLSGPVRNLTVGATVSISLGCNHKMDDCASLHNNIVNFGGQPYIPLKNPVGIRNNFY